MLSRGDPTIGKPLVDLLGWRENKAGADICWKRIKQSIHGVRVTRFEIYMTAYESTKTTITCRDNIAFRRNTLTNHLYLIGSHMKQDLQVNIQSKHSKSTSTYPTHNNPPLIFSYHRQPK
ncbi:hypothetical protein YC2023_071266 [Brassica napus]